MTRTRRLIVASALAATLLGTVATPASAAPSDPSDTGSNARRRGVAEPIEVQLLSFNDFHGHLQPPSGSDETLGPQLDPSGTLVGGAEYLATHLQQRRDASTADRSFTVTAGDLIGGSPFLSGLFHDEPSVESLDALDLDVSGVGNHEFDEGLTELLRMQEGGCHPEDGCYFPKNPYRGADFDWLAANVVHEDTGESVLPPTWTRRVQGVRIGFIGMTLEDTPTLVAQSGIQGLDFQDEVAAARRATRALQDEGVKTIVVLLHEGGVQAGTYRKCDGISGPIVDIAERMHKQIDMIVTGHTHQPYVCNIPDPLGRRRLVTSASSFGRVVTDTTLSINPATGNVQRRQGLTRWNQVLIDRGVTPDGEQTDIIGKWNERSAPIANRVIGEISEDLLRSPNRDTESNLANVIADAQLAYTEPEDNGGSQIAFMNPGGVRADLTVNDISGGEEPGEVTYGEAFEVQPFGNLLTTMDLTGEQIERLLEQQHITGRPGGRDRLIFGVSEGFAFTFNASGPEGDKIDPASITLDGVPLVPAETYRVTTNNFLADGGDAFTVFTEGTNRAGAGEDLVALEEYFEANSPVGAPEDRIAGI